jgi:membrane-associated protease RseP (regulator of RpoE activity)
LPGKPAERAGLVNGDRILAVDGRAMRSPSDVASLTNAHPGATLTYRVQRGDRTFDVPVVAETVEQNGRRIGLAGVRLRIDPDVAERSTVVVAMVSAVDRAGIPKTRAGSVHRPTLGRIVTARIASLKGISGRDMADIAGQSAQAGSSISCLSGGDQHQPRSAEPVAGAATGWGAFTVLSRRNYQRQSRIRPCVRGRSAHRNGDARRTDGLGALQ